MMMIGRLFEDKYPAVNTLLQIITRESLVLLLVPDKSASNL